MKGKELGMSLFRHRAELRPLLNDAMATRESIMTTSLLLWLLSATCRTKLRRACNSLMLIC
eukprot:4392767-Amphidinium_carterae.1